MQMKTILKDKAGTIRRISDFLNCDLTKDDVAKISEHCHIDNMRSNDKVNWSWFREYVQPDETQGFGFINKGYRCHIPPKLNYMYLQNNIIFLT